METFPRRHLAFTGERRSASRVANFPRTDMEILPSFFLVGMDKEQPTGTGAITLAALTQSGVGVMSPSGVGSHVHRPDR